jgi:hypothetical protein
MYDFGLVHYWLTAGRVFILMHRNRQARTISAHGLPVLCYSLKLSRQIKHDECWMHCVHKTLVFLLNSCLLQDHHILTRKSLLVLSIYQQQLTQFRQTVRYDRTSHVWRLNRVPFHSFVQSDTACQLFFFISQQVVELQDIKMEACSLMRYSFQIDSCKATVAYFSTTF